MNREEDEKLWDLLGRSAEPKVSPFFARNVLRKIREAQGEPSRAHWWNLRWLMPTAGIAVVVIAGLIIPSQLVNRSHSESRSEAAAFTEGQDGDLLADLDDLVGVDDGAAWDEGVLL